MGFVLATNSPFPPPPRNRFFGVILTNWKDRHRLLLELFGEESRGMQLWEGNDPLDYFSMVPKPYTPPPRFSKKPRSTFHSVYDDKKVPRLAPLRNLVPGMASSKGEEKERKERETKELVRGAMISRCNRYDSRHTGWWWRRRWWWPFVLRWTVNAKPRVSLAWPSRRPDHNAWSCRSQADHNHGDPTFPPPSSLLRLSRRFASARARLFPLNNPPCVPPSWLSSHRSLRRLPFPPRVEINLLSFRFV